METRNIKATNDSMRSSKNNFETAPQINVGDSINLSQNISMLRMKPPRANNM